MSDASLQALEAAKIGMINDARVYFAELNGGGLVGNPLLDWGVVGFPSRQAGSLYPLEYHWNFVTGALDEMFGGFSTLEGEQGFGNRTGRWNATTMNTSIAAILNMSAAHQAVLVRGYPGPCGVPFVDINTSLGVVVIPSWPEAYERPQPTTLEEVRAAAGDEKLQVQALAPFLITAAPTVWWSYAWFYSSYSGWFPCSDDSCTGPTEWYPMLSKQLGQPLGPAVNSGFKWTRKFEHCDVSIDLQDREASAISWH